MVGGWGTEHDGLGSIVAAAGIGAHRGLCCALAAAPGQAFAQDPAPEPAPPKSSAPKPEAPPSAKREPAQKPRDARDTASRTAASSAVHAAAGRRRAAAAAGRVAPRVAAPGCTYSAYSTRQARPEARARQGDAEAQAQAEPEPSDPAGNPCGAPGLSREEATSPDTLLMVGGLALFFLVLADIVFLTLSTRVLRVR